jgi:hypothetical protein
MDHVRLAPPGLHHPEALALGGWSAPEPPLAGPGQLLLAAARVTLTDDQRSELAARAAALTPDEWQEALQLAEAQGLASLLWYHLASEHLGDLMPPLLWEAASVAYREQLLVQMRLVHALRQALAACHDAGIRVLLHKGPAMALRLYGRLGPRPSGDLDLLVHPATSQKQAYRALAQAYVKWQAAGIQVELSWQLVRRPPYRVCFPSDTLWKRALLTRFGTQPCFTLATADELRYLCVHYAMHGMARLLWLVDIVELLNRASQDAAWNWHTFVAETSGAGVALPVALAFLQAQTLLGAPVPGDALNQLVQAARSPEEQARWRALIEPKLSLRKAFLYLRSGDPWHEHLRTIKTLVWPDPAYLYDCHDFIPGQSLTKARLHRLSRVVRQALP